MKEQSKEKNKGGRKKRGKEKGKMNKSKENQRPKRKFERNEWHDDRSRKEGNIIDYLIRISSSFQQMLN